MHDDDDAQNGYDESGAGDPFLTWSWGLVVRSGQDIADETWTDFARRVERALIDAALSYSFATD